MQKKPHLILIIDFLCYGAAFVFVQLGGRYVSELVHRFNHARHELGALAEAFHDGTPVPLAAAAGIFAFFAIDEGLSRVFPPRRPRDVPFGASWAFIVSAAALLGVLCGFWLTDGPHLPWELGELGCNPYGVSSAILGGALAAGLIAAAVARARPRRRHALTLLAPLGAILGITALAQHVRRVAEEANGALPVAWPSPLLGGLAVALAAAVALPMLLLERRRGTWHHAAGLFCGLLWVLAARLAGQVLAPMHWMSTVRGPANVETAAVGIVLGCFLVALFVRLHVHERRKKYYDYMNGRDADDEARWDHVRS